MPTANANTGNSFTKALSYVQQENKKSAGFPLPVVLEVNQIYGTTREMGRQMREVANERTRVKKPVIHLQINFHPEEKLERDRVQKAIDQILLDAGIEKHNHQYIVVQHRDKPHDHYHVIANRIGLDGTLMNDHRIKDRLQVACDRVEKEQGLRKTKGRTVIYNPDLEKGYEYVQKEKRVVSKKVKPVQDKNQAVMESKQDLQKEIAGVLSQKEISTPEQFRTAMNSRGVEVLFLENKNGIYGVSFRENNIAVKGTDVGYKWNDLKKALESIQGQQQGKASSKVPSETNPKILGEELEKEMAKHIREHVKPTSFSFALVDDAIREHMRRVDPVANVWDTFSSFKNHEQVNENLYRLAEKEIRDTKEPSEKIQNTPPAKETTPVPTDKEKAEIILVEKYNGAIRASLRELRKDWEGGAIDRRPEAIFEKHGFTSEPGQFVFKAEGSQITVPKKTLDTVQATLEKQKQHYEKRLDEYQKLMEQPPQKVRFLDYLTGNARKIKANNLTLERKQKEALRPEFRPQVVGLQERDFTLVPSFTEREREHKRQMQMEKFKAILHGKEAPEKDLGEENQQKRGRGMRM